MFILMETTCQSSNQSSSSNAFTLASLDTPLVAEKQTYPYISTGVPYQDNILKEATGLDQYYE